MSESIRPGVRELQEALRSRRLRVDELLRSVLQAIAGSDAAQPPLGAFLSVVGEEDLLTQVADLDRALEKGDEIGPLAGIPVAVKDNICTTSLPTSCGSRILEGYVAPYEATVVRRLRAAGALVVGKTNLDEFAMGSSTENSGFGPTRNPLDPERVPGGSSGGSAAAVAAGLVPLALGSDTGGSGVDRFDSTSVDLPVPAFQDSLGEGPGGLVVGVPREYFPDDLDPKVAATCRSAIERLERLGAEIREISLPHTGYAVPAYYLVANAEASSNLARYDGVRYGLRASGAESTLAVYRATRGAGFGREVKRRIVLGTYGLSAGYYDAYYGTGQRVRRLIAEDFQRAFADGVDVIFTPTAPTVAFRLGERIDDPVLMYLSDVFTVTANLARLPAISIPVGSADGLPVGGQLLGRVFDEAKLLRAAQALERAVGDAASEEG
jgi:aspartyl-tRNA(Asn)/glutamyl-tRNA(Gln) amidotransferase subunit A